MKLPSGLFAMSCHVMSTSKSFCRSRFTQHENIQAEVTSWFIFTLSRHDWMLRLPDSSDSYCKTLVSLGIYFTSTYPVANHITLTRQPPSFVAAASFERLNLSKILRTMFRNGGRNTRERNFCLALLLTLCKALLTHKWFEWECIFYFFSFFL